MRLYPTAFEALPLGSIKPRGWLRDQLRIQADGLTGHLDEHWPDLGPNNGWLGGTGESWERGPYYLDGLLPLSHLLEDEHLTAKAQRWIEWTLASQRADGQFGPDRIETVDGLIDKRHDWWHLMIMLKVLMQYEEATRDGRVVPFLLNFFRYVRETIRVRPLAEWARARGGEMLLCLVWLYKKTGESFLLDVAGTVAEQTTDWTGIFTDFPFRRKVEQFDHRTHVVNVAMGLKTPAVLFELTGDSRHREAVDRGIDSLMRHHGQAHGMFSGDEWLSGTHPSQGVELCAVVEYMFTMEQLVRVFGDGKYGDILEKVAFNALPAAVSPDWTSHQYDQQVNQVVCNVAGRRWSNADDANIFGLEPNFGCCTANMHQGWPKLAAHLWMSDGHGGLAAVSYAPCTVHARVGAEAALRLDVEGGYPFRETVEMRLHLDRSERFALSFRMPAWCEQPSLRVNGEAVPLSPVNGYAKVERQWQDGDEVRLALPMPVRKCRRAMDAVSVERGPLVFVLPVGESWQRIVRRDRFHDWEVYPTTPWKYGLLADAGFEVVTRPIPRQPFESAAAPVRLKTRGQIIRNWRMEANSAAAPPMRPAREGEAEDIELVPYGSARLRIGEFPEVR